MAKARTFTVQDGEETRVYHGFDMDYTPKDLEHVVLVLIDGEIQVYATMYPNRLLGDLFRFFVDRGEDPTILGVYTRKDLL